MMFSIGSFLHRDRLRAVKRDLAGEINMNNALQCRCELLEVRLRLALEVIDGLREEAEAMSRRAREREAFVAQISRFVEKSEPNPMDMGDW